MSFDPTHNNAHPFSTTLHLHIPTFMCSSAPTLAPGGGAEVLPVSLLSDNPLANTWFSNNGFTPRAFDEQFPPSSDDQQHHHQQQQQQQDHDFHPHQTDFTQLQSGYVQHRQSTSAPFDFDSFNQHQHNHIPSPPLPQPRTLSQAELALFLQSQNTSSFLQHPALPPELPPPPSAGLPVYSSSGFDLLSILARVAYRPHPRVILGPVDMTCSFVVVDVRRYDQPIVYCSPSFCRLTGYSESETLGRNCRFLQAPNGQVLRGEERRFTSHEAVVHLKKHLSADKECQTSILNYKKDGTAFVNLVTVIPIPGGVSGAPQEESDVIYHVGFQVDLAEQPNAILEKLRDGSYIVDYSCRRNPLSQQPAYNSPLSLHNRYLLPKDRKSQLIPSVAISKHLKKLLADPTFVRSIPISSKATIPPPMTSSTTRTEGETTPPVTGPNQLLHLILLEASPDFIHVVSLKGSFLYVAPSVRRVLGYEPEDMVGRSIADFAHLEDVVPLMRELKEGSATGLSAAIVSSSADGMGSSIGNNNGDAVAISRGNEQLVHAAAAAAAQIAPRTVDLLFRARTKAGIYVWIECKGRLYVEPGKGRKAIILSGRAREMPKLGWDLVSRGGGLNMPVFRCEPSASGLSACVETEFWGMMTSGGCGNGAVSFLLVGSGVRDILGWNSTDLVGREVPRFIVDGAQELVNEVLAFDRINDGVNPRRVRCRMQHKDGSHVDVVFILYQPFRDPLVEQSTQSVGSISPAPLIYQLKSVNGPVAQTSPLAHDLTGDVFDDLDTSRGSSWQYELQQIRFANQRLEEEITGLEKQIDEAEGTQPNILEELQHTQPMTNYVGVTKPSAPEQPGQGAAAATHPQRSVSHSRLAASAFQQSHESEVYSPPGPAFPGANSNSSFITAPHPSAPPPPSCVGAPNIQTLASLYPSLTHQWNPSSLVQDTQRQHPSYRGLKRTWDMSNGQ